MKRSQTPELGWKRRTSTLLFSPLEGRPRGHLIMFYIPKGHLRGRHVVFFFFFFSNMASSPAESCVGFSTKKKQTLWSWKYVSIVKFKDIMPYFAVKPILSVCWILDQDVTSKWFVMSCQIKFSMGTDETSTWSSLLASQSHGNTLC